MGLFLWLCISCSAMLVFGREAVELQIPALYFFGSSFLDVGTNNFLNYTSDSNFLPFGETYFHHPTGRHSNGLILSDFIELKLGFPFLPPYLDPNGNSTQGVNFASSGSGLLESTRLLGPAIPLHNQTQQFLHLLGADSSARKKLPESLIIVNVGTNDLLLHVLYVNNIPASLLVPLMLSKYEHFLKVLYNEGARNFLITGLTPIGYSPPIRLEERVKLLNPAVRQYNAGLKKMVAELTVSLPGAEMMFFNPYELFDDMIHNGSKYGFEETRSSCYVPNEFLCVDPSKYLYWNDHPTQEAFKYLADSIWNGDSSLISPINLETFVHTKKLRFRSSKIENRHAT